MILHDYEYDLINHPYLSEFIDAGSGVTTQSFKIPAGVKYIKGIRVKLSKCGHPGSIHYSIGHSVSGVEIAEGHIAPNDVLPVFEIMVGEDFAPVPVKEGETYHLRLRVTEGKKPLDAYRVYGPNTRVDTGGSDNIKCPYWWYSDPDWCDAQNISLPHDYQGANYPQYTGGHRIRADGTQTWSMSFAILTDKDEALPSLGKQRFEFIQHILAPPFTEWRYLRDESAEVEEDTLLIDESWGIECLDTRSPVTRNALAEIVTFLKRVMGIDLSSANKNRNIVFTVTNDEEIPLGRESFTAIIEGDGIRIVAREPEGILRAVHWMEDEMLCHGAPVLHRGNYEIRFRHGLRMMPGIYTAPLCSYELQDAEIWTRGYTWRLARAGYNAIYLQANIEEFIEDSAIFPEMNDDGAAVAIERLRRITEVASEYGVDVYVDLKTGYYKPFSDDIYERLPKIRSFAKHGNYPCSGQQIVLDFYRETVSHLFEEVRKLKGLIIIYDTEGFYSCFNDNNQKNCPYCKNYPVEELSSRLFGTLKDAIRQDREDTELILWTYSCDTPWNYRVIEAMPTDVTLMACYSQFRELDRFGMKVKTDDYSLCSEEPSEYFLKIMSLARKKGMKFICKTEDTYGQEFVSTPYTPCLEQHQRRWDGVAKQDVDGYLAAYIHLGFMPGPCADLSRLNSRVIEKNGELVSYTAEQKLKKVATMEYGAAAAGDVVTAWEAFSKAIREYFPYSPGVCRYPGPLQSSPAQPFYMDPKRAVPRQRSRGYVSDLKWTDLPQRLRVDGSEEWNAAFISRCLQAFSRCYQEGNRHLERALVGCDEEYREVLSREINVSRAEYLQVRSLLNYIQFIQLRDAYRRTGERVLLETLVFVCEGELSNATGALEVCKQDSRIGFSCQGDGTVRGGLFTPAAIEQKITSLRQTLSNLHSTLERS